MVKSRKPVATMPSTASTRAFSVAGRFRPKPATAPEHMARISTHSTIEPSWFPHVPVSL